MKKDPIEQTILPKIKGYEYATRCFLDFAGYDLMS